MSTYSSLRLVNNDGRLSTLKAPLCDQNPTENNHLTNKNYVDDEIQTNKLTINEVKISKNSSIKQNVDVSLNSMTVVTNDDSWSSLGGGTNGTVHALAIDSNKNVYVAGAFTQAGTLPCNNIAMWNPSISQWSTLGTATANGTNTVNSGTTPVSVTSLAIDSDDNVYVGGFFTQAAGVSYNHIAQWNPTTQVWSGLTTGTQGVVNALAFDSNMNLYVAGEFANAGGVACYSIALWNKTTQVWSALKDGNNNGVSGTVFALAFDSINNLYLAGVVSAAGSVSCNNVVKWNGSAWSALGSGVNDRVNSLTVDSDNNVYVGGNFTQAGSVPCSNVAKWDITTSIWSGFNDAFDGQVFSLAVDSNMNLYVGGTFVTVGSITCDSIAMWNSASSQWLALGTGVKWGVFALAIDYRDNVLVGGQFQSAGGVDDTFGLAEWGWSTNSDVSVNNVSDVTLAKKSHAAFLSTATGSVFKFLLDKL